ncbi:hypothetical protein MKQ70_21765 [Chitinophaga sedimenti]|uniref:hypothetical protein n=1 Tax=Chitinophaga sedimenti TaxID=2033606 RepID=UPI002004CE28|nr:hypothetical protein [Chitinophaga sedimenti]MCK7557490.1 hypothetical protein [Chitinophaga sedimenti]
MNATKITSQNFLDILFDGRNKSYGAYEHRVSYEKECVTPLLVRHLLLHFLSVDI